MSTNIAYKIIPLMDLTSLNLADTDDSIIKLCKVVSTLPVLPASICIYPQFVSLAREHLENMGLHNFPIATVGNFPAGTPDIPHVIQEINLAGINGATEIDIVAPYHDFMNGREQLCADFLHECRSAASTTGLTLKIILETGELDDSHINSLSRLAIEADVDFIKTSTGKVHIGATLAAAKIMLRAIAESGKIIGFKAAGGIHTAQDALGYMDLAQSICGEDYIAAPTFRLGASSLLNNLISSL